MKTLCILLTVFLINSCTSHRDIERDGSKPSAKPTGGTYKEVDYYTPTPCNDSLFLALKSKKLTDLTAQEYEYFHRKFQECEGVLNTNKGSAPEWIVAIVTLLGVMAGLVLAATK